MRVSAGSWRDGDTFAVVTPVEASSHGGTLHQRYSQIQMLSNLAVSLWHRYHFCMRLNISLLLYYPSRSHPPPLSLPLQFYQVAVLYMATRLFCNLSQAFVPIYLQDHLHLPEESVAYIPLVMYISGFLMTTMMRALNKYIGRKVSVCVCMCLCLC